MQTTAIEHVGSLPKQPSGPLPGYLSDINFKAVNQKSLLPTDCIGTSSRNEGSFLYTERKKLNDMEEYMNAKKYPLLDVTQQLEFTTHTKGISLISCRESTFLATSSPLTSHLNMET